MCKNILLNDKILLTFGILSAIFNIRKLSIVVFWTKMATHRFLKRRGAMTSSPVRILGRVLNVRVGSDIDHQIFLTSFLLPYTFFTFFSSSFNTFLKLSLAFSSWFSFLVGCLLHILPVLCLLYLLSANPSFSSYMPTILTINTIVLWQLDLT